MSLLSYSEGSLVIILHDYLRGRQVVAGRSMYH